jgi:DNA-binding response OmpR family regulator
MKSTKILLAEDDINLGNLLKNYLAAKNYETRLVSNGNLLSKHLTKNNIICVFLI